MYFFTETKKWGKRHQTRELKKREYEISLTQADRLGEEPGTRADSGWADGCWIGGV